MNADDHIYCRYCAELKNVSELCDLSEFSPKQLEIHEKLSLLNLHRLHSPPNDAVPKFICNPCIEALNTAHKFVVKAKESIDYLVDLFAKNIIRVSNLDENAPTAIELLNELNFGDPSVSVVKLEDDKYDSEGNSSDYEDGNTFGHDESGLCAMLADAFESKEQTDDAKSWISFTWLCQVCQEPMSDIYQLRSHCELVHKTCCSFKCTDCGMDYNMFNTFVSHVRQHRESLRHYCPHCNLKLENGEQHTHNGEMCQRCGKFFSTKKKLQRHRTKRLHTVEVNKIVDKSWTGYPWTCNVCEDKFADVTTLRTHTKEQHNKCFAMRCADCSETEENFRDFIYHVRRHRPFMKHHCHYCNHKFEENTRHTKFTEHITTHFTIDNACEGCGEMFIDKQDLTRHVATYDPPKPKFIPFKKRERPLSNEDLTCDICSKVAKTMQALRVHKSIHTERTRDFTCDKCGKTFYTSYDLTNHCEIHENKEPVVCEICKKTFKSLRTLKKHVVSHNEERPFQCEICHKRFRRNRNLVSHQIVHSSDTPFQCELCEKAFKHEKYLKAHMRQHTGDKPYSCPDCGMEFTNWANCNKHMKRKHGTTLAKHVITPFGKVPINPKSLKAKKITDLDTVKEWTQQILAPQKRGRKKMVVDKTESGDVSAI